MGKKMNISGFKIDFPKKLKDKILVNFNDVLDSGMFASGKYVGLCEEKIKEITNAKNVFMAASGSSALEACAATFKKIHGLGKVLIPANTFVATSAAFEKVGFEVEFYPNDIERISFPLLSSGEYVGFVIVDLGGRIPENIKNVVKWMHDKGMWVCEDACQAFGSTLGGRHAGTFADIGTYSFFGTKVLTSGEGGAIVTNNPLYANRIKFYRSFGNVDRSPNHYTEGWNCFMDEFSAAILYAQLDGYREILLNRSQIREKYRKKLKNTKEIHFIKNPRQKHFFNGYKTILFLDNEVNKEEFISKCKEKGVKFQGNVYDTTLPEQFVYRRYKCEMPTHWQEKLKRMICLPGWYGMTDKEIDYVVGVIKKVLKEIK